MKLTKLIRKAPSTNKHHYKSDDYEEFSSEYRRMFESMRIVLEGFGIVTSNDDEAFIDFISLSFSQPKVKRIRDAINKDKVNQKEENIHF